LSSKGTAAKRSRQSFCSAKVRVPEFSRSRIGGDLALDAGLHINAVNVLAVGGKGEPQRQLAGVVLGLRDTGGQRFIPSLGLGINESNVCTAMLSHPAKKFPESRFTVDWVGRAA
jgi:hypothetical protein